MNTYPGHHRFFEHWHLGATDTASEALSHSGNSSSDDEFGGGLFTSGLEMPAVPCESRQVVMWVLKWDENDYMHCTLTTLGVVDFGVISMMRLGRTRGVKR